MKDDYTRLDETRANEGTYIAQSLDMHSSRTLLEGAYERIAVEVEDLLETDIKGVVLALVYPPTGKVSIKTIPIQHKSCLETVILGRHECSGLCFPFDMSISLRHMLFLLSRGEDGYYLRLLDLRSGVGLIDANGIPHYSIASNGPLALRLGESALFVLPGDTKIRQGEGQRAYDKIDWIDSIPWIPNASPEQHIQELSASTHARTAVSMAWSEDNCLMPITSKVTENAAGIMRIKTDGELRDVAINRTSLRRGLLIGRYPRCDLNDENLTFPKTLSRVHALMIEVDGRIYMVDTGSSNGILHHDFEIDNLALPEYLPSSFVMGGVIFVWIPEAGGI